MATTTQLKRPPAPSLGPASDVTTIPAVATDGSLYPIEKLEAHRLGVQHIAISVFLFSGDRLLIQQRAAGKYHCGGLWANTCCTHPHWGEAVHDAAVRRLGEELGIRATPELHPAGVVDYCADVGNGLTENERVSLFNGRVDAATFALDPTPDEVSATRWVTMDELRDEVAAGPDRFTPWFRLYLDRWASLWNAAD